MNVLVQGGHRALRLGSRHGVAVQAGASGAVRRTQHARAVLLLLAKVTAARTLRIVLLAHVSESL